LHLSLSRIRTLVVNFASLLDVPDSLAISTSRLGGADSLLLDLLEVRYQDLFDAQDSFTILYRSLFRHLDPVRCTYRAVDLEDRSEPWFFIGGSEVLGWLRIQQIDIFGLIIFTAEGDFNLSQVAGLPPPSLAQRRVIRLHMASLLNAFWLDFNRILNSISENIHEFCVHATQPGSLVLVAHSEEEKQELEQLIGAKQELARWRSVFAVELEI